MTKGARLVQLAREAAGGAYVFATSGQTCTPALRRKQAASKSAYADNIYKYCPVLSGKQSACDGCQWNGRAADDCRGLVYRLMKAAGMSVSSVGSNSQWNDEDAWSAKCVIADMPPGQPCIVFHQSGSIMNHVGICLGDGYEVDARGHQKGTVHKPLSEYPWTHYALPVGINDEYIPADTRPTLRNGSKGEDVRELQRILRGLGYTLEIDGKFGPITTQCVKSFQGSNGLKVDGIVGPLTWAALQRTENDEDGEDKPVDDADEPSEPSDESSATNTLTIEERLTRLEQAVFGQEGDVSNG